MYLIAIKARQITAIFMHIARHVFANANWGESRATA